MREPPPLPPFFEQMIDQFGGALRIARVDDLASEGVLFVEDGNHGENRPRQDEFCAAGIPFVRPPDLVNGRIDLTKCECINETGRRRVRKGIGRGGDVILSHRATVGRLAITSVDDPEFVTNPGTTVWRTLDTSVLDRRYLYYFLGTSAFQDQLQAEAGGTSTFPYVSLTQQRRLWLALPPIEIQRQIGHILGLLDDKIEQNRRTGRKLEALARAAFKAWFVDFEPVKAKAAGATAFPGMPAEIFADLPARLVDSDLGPVPEGWHMRRLEDVLTLHYGKALNKAKRQPGEVPVYGSGGINGTHSESLVDGPGIIVGRKGSVGTLYWEDRDFFPIDTTYYVEPAADFGLHYLFELLQTLGLETMNTDAAVPGLNRENAYRLEVVVPPADMSRGFDQYAKTLRDLVSHAGAESAKLAAMRDYLLPRLLSGRVRVVQRTTGTMPSSLLLQGASDASSRF